MKIIPKNPSLKIYILEGDKQTLQHLKVYFKKLSYTVSCAQSYKDVLNNLPTLKPDLFILDPYPEGEVGLPLCSHIRANPDYQDLPIIALSSRTSEKDIVDAFSAGVDDYITKPFALGEFGARIQALLRRTQKKNDSHILETRTIRLNRNTRSITRNGRDVLLGPLELKLLEYFILNKGRVLSRARLLEKIWTQDENVIDRTVDVYVLRLRRALILGSENNPIKTVRSLGYIFDDEPDEMK